jgi:Domain of unknown function (DUF4382)
MRLPQFAAAAALALAACYTETTTGIGGNGGKTTVELTDSPFPYDSVARVDIYIVSIAVRNEPDTSNTGTGWITVAEPHRRFDLIALSGGVTDTLGANVVPAGDYKAVRMVIDTDSSYVTSVTGQRVAVDWQSSAGRPSLFALVENPIGIPDSGTSVVIDFDVGRSFLLARDVGCPTRCDGFVFSPVFRAVNRYATGAVSGIVSGDTLAVYAAPINKVTVTVYSGDPARAVDEWWVRATGRTDATGHFRIAYLLPGTYILRADAPRTSPFTPGERAGVVVTAGYEVVNQNITLPRGTTSNIVVTPLPPYAYVGDSLELTAALVDSAGYPVAGATYTWSNLDTAVANLYVSFSYPNRAVFRPKAAGTARILVTADALSRTLTIPVLAAPATGVDWVQVAPDSTIASAGDSVYFIATARDSAGAALPNQTYTWVSSDTSVATIMLTVGTGAPAALVRARRAGSAVIRATSGGKTGSAVLRVQ